MNDVGIRAATSDDCESIARWLSLPAINRWLGSEWRGAEVDARRVAFMLKRKDTRVFMTLAAGKPSGIVVVSNIDAGDAVALVWYALGESALAGRGVITRAVELVLDRVFTELGLETVHAWIHPDNRASRRVLEKTGFKVAGRLRDATMVDEVRADRVLFDITRADWQAGREGR